MSESVSLPSLGESVTEGTVTRWLKNVGDSVEVDEPLLEVSTDKVDTEIPSPISGVLEKILVDEDETVEVGAELAIVGSGDAGSDTGDDGAGAAQQESSQPSGDAAEQDAAPSEATDSAPAAAEANEPAASRSQPTTEPAERSATPAPAEPSTDESADAAPETVAAPEKSEDSRRDDATSASPRRAAAGHASSGYVTPIVRKLARDQGVDLSRVEGSGAGGRIRKQDVLAASQPDSPDAAQVGASESVTSVRGTTKPLSRLRKVIADRAVTSLQSTAQLTSVVEADVTALSELRASVKQQFADKHGTALSFLPFFMRAAIEALQQYPDVNASIDGDNVVYPDAENVSVAVDTPRGLLTPVVHNAGSQSIAQLAASVADLARRTRNNELSPDELAGGTFTITNTGSRGALFDTPVVFLPQVAILGTGAVTKRPAVISSDDGSDAIAVRSTVYLSLSYDHRLIDGADAARFLSAVSQRLEGADFDDLLDL